jgi:7,8-dihydropterin-6-yl-methyl-4-(beta-D-ribofuranosyl)aminobenzene 5'-phosphate synthase
MKLINLVENTPGAPGCAAAHGLSFFIETGKHRLLLDAGPGPVLVENAKALGVDLSRVDTVVLSHGHYDHADGLPVFAALNSTAPIYLHRGAEQERYSLDPEGYRYNGMSPSGKKLPNLVWTQGRVDLDEELSLFDGASHQRFWPLSNRKLFTRREGAMVQDPFDHEQYLVIREGEKRVLLSGCAHNGVVNILERFRQVYGGAPDAVVSGFHMMQRTGSYSDEAVDVIRQTALWLRENYDGSLYTCHCTGLEPYEMMKEILGERLHYIHCGESLKL